MALAGYLLIYTRSIDLLPNELIIAIEGWLRPCGLELGRARVLGRPWSQKAAARICVRRLALRRPLCQRAWAAPPSARRAPHRRG
jgi:hypothetical protein